MSDEPRKLAIGLSYWPDGRHPSAWRLPEAEVGGILNPAFLTKTVRTAERGLFDYIFTGNQVASTDYSPFRTDGFVFATYAAAVSTHLGVVASVNASYEDPYIVARLSASLDHYSGGRSGVNIVTGHAGNDAAARNFGRDAHFQTEEKYERAEEFMTVLTLLWDSWDDGVVVGADKRGPYVDTSKSHVLDHVGKYFSVEGPLNVPRSPQGRPVVLHAGTSEQSFEFGAKWADIRFAPFKSLEINRAYYAEQNARVAAHGRDARAEHRVLPGLTFYVAETSRAAHAKFKEVQDLVTAGWSIERLADFFGTDLGSTRPDERIGKAIDPERITKNRHVFDNAVAAFGDDDASVEDLFHYVVNGPANQPSIVGSADEVADWIEEGFQTAVFDGVKVFPPYSTAPLEAFVELVVPRLQRKGIFRTEYEATTLRGNLGLPRPASSFAPAAV